MEGQLKLTLVSGIFFLKMAVHGVLTDFLYLTIVANFSLFSPNSCVGIFHYSMCIYFLKKNCYIALIFIDMLTHLVTYAYLMQ